LNTKILSLITLSLFLSACNATSESSKSVTDTGIKMQIGQTYTLNSGQRIMPASSDAKVSITRNSEKSSSEVILLAGQAKIEEK
jgi:hypothetical protein